MHSPLGWAHIKDLKADHIHWMASRHDPEHYPVNYLYLADGQNLEASTGLFGAFCFIGGNLEGSKVKPNTSENIFWGFKPL